MSNSFGGRRLSRLLLILLLPGLIGALLLAAGRYRAESGNRAVEIVLDYSGLQNLSVASGVSLPVILSRFKDAGATGVAVTEDTLGDLLSMGEISYEHRSSVLGPLTAIRVRDRVLAERIFRSLSIRLAPEMISPRYEERQGRSWVPDAVVVRAAPPTLNSMGIGLPEDAVRLVQSADLDVVARLVNHPAITTTTIDASFEDLKRNGISRLICAREEVIGFRGLVDYAAEKIQSLGLVYGSVEFGKQKGDSKMSARLKSEFVRVHSITQAELAGMAPSTAAERFVRAVKERNIRLCYVHFMDTCGYSPVEDSVTFVSSISRQLIGSGFAVGLARPFEPTPRPTLPLMLIALSIVAGGVLLLESAMSLSVGWRYGLLVGGFLIGAALVMMGGRGIQALALLSALIFPTLGVMAIAGPSFNRDTGEKSPLVRAAVMFLGTSAVSLFGALMIIGLLADRSFMVKVNQFSGIKLAHLVPMMLVVFAMAAGLPMFGRPFREVRDAVAGNLRRLVANPLFLWHVFAVIFVFVLIGFALLRTGNDPGVGVSGIELKFRAVLDKILVVRPRTKEFMVGHPLMLVGIALLLTRRRAWGLPLVALGMLGQVSLVNTFCHIHTPLGISALRAFNGLLLGLIIGVVAWLALSRVRLGGAPP